MHVNHFLPSLPLAVLPPTRLPLSQRGADRRRRLSCSGWQQHSIPPEISAAPLWERDGSSSSGESRTLSAPPGTHDAVHCAQVTQPTASPGNDRKSEHRWWWRRRTLLLLSSNFFCLGGIKKEREGKRENWNGASLENRGGEKQACFYYLTNIFTLCSERIERRWPQVRTVSQLHTW